MNFDSCPSAMVAFPLNFTLPLPNNDTMAAWLSNIWNSPSTPGTVTLSMSPLTNKASGDTISKYIFLKISILKFQIPTHLELEFGIFYFGIYQAMLD